MGGVSAKLTRRTALGMVPAAMATLQGQNSPKARPFKIQVPKATLDRILRLSAFDGDSAAALRTLHAHFAERFPDCSLALVLVRDLAQGQCRLAGLIGPDGREHVPNVDPFGDRSTGVPLQVTQHHREPELLWKPRDLLVENRDQIVPDAFGHRFRFRQGLHLPLPPSGDRFRGR